MEPYKLRNIIICQTAALEAAVKVMIADRQALFESNSAKVPDRDFYTIPDMLIWLELQHMDTTIEQCQAAIVSGRAVQTA